MGRYKTARRKVQCHQRAVSAAAHRVKLPSLKSRKGRKLNKWAPQRMEAAVKEFLSSKPQTTSSIGLGLRQVARAWDVPYATFRRRVLGTVKGCEHESGRNPVLPPAAERDLANVITELARAGFPLSRQEVRQLAFEYAQKNALKGFSDDKGNAGYYWFVGFMTRHPEITIRKTENLSAPRAMAMNPVQVGKWFSEYESMISKLEVHDPSHIWNVDEVGMQNIYVADKVVAPTGENAYSITAGEKGETSTVIVATNAIGDVVPPVVIHKGKIVGKNWKNGAPLDALVTVSPSGWVTKEIFAQFGLLFQNFLNKKGYLGHGRAHVVILDNHHSHLFNLEFLKLMKDNNIHVIGLPPHTSHWLQPLDKVHFSVLKKAWNKEVRAFTRDTVGKKVEKSDFFRVFNPPCQLAMTVENAQSAFRSTGLFPVNINAIPAEAYNPSSVFDRPLAAEVSTPDEVVSEDVSASADVTEQSPYQIISLPVEIAQLFPGSLINVPYTVTLLTQGSGVPVPAEISEQPSNLIRPTSSHDIEQSSHQVVSIPAEIAQLSPSSCRFNVPCTTVTTEPVEPAEQSSDQVTTVSSEHTHQSAEHVISGPAEVDDHCYAQQEQAVSESVVFTEQPSNQVSTVPIDNMWQSAEQLVTELVQAKDQSFTSVASGLTVTGPEQAATAFSDLISVPHRARPTAKKPRAKPPQFEMTSEATMQYVESRSSERQPKKTGKQKINVKSDTRKKSRSNCPKQTNKLHAERQKSGSPLQGEQQKASRNTRGRPTARSATKSANDVKAVRPRNEKKTNTKTTKSKKTKKEATNAEVCKIYCLVCGDDCDEGWIQCCTCKEWAHEDCADLTDADFYYCDNCK